jgi:hypothetical protein
MHRGGGAMMRWWGRIGTAVFQWRGGPGDLRWPRGGGVLRQETEAREGSLVARGKKSGDEGGGALLKGCGGEVAEGEVR